MGGIENAIGDGARELVKVDPVLGFVILILIAAFAALWWYHVKTVERKDAKIDSLTQQLLTEAKASISIGEGFRKTFEDVIDRLERAELAVAPARRRT